MTDKECDASVTTMYTSELQDLYNRIDDLDAQVQAVLWLAEIAESKGQRLQSIPELVLVGKAYAGMARRIRAAVNNAKNGVSG